MVFAQVRISVINTAFTAVYLGLALPFFDVHLPLMKTMMLITFVAGLLPVVGNLISNTVILIASLGVSVYVAFASLVFLIVIHKLEYFLNARIIGSRIHARPWELLIAMLVMEAAFGLPGVLGGADLLRLSEGGTRGAWPDLNPGCLEIVRSVRTAGPLRISALPLKFGPNLRPRVA